MIFLFLCLFHLFLSKSRPVFSLDCSLKQFIYYHILRNCLWPPITFSIACFFPCLIRTLFFLRSITAHWTIASVIKKLFIDRMAFNQKRLLLPCFKFNLVIKFSAIVIVSELIKIVCICIVDFSELIETMLNRAHFLHRQAEKAARKGNVEEAIQVRDY